jgi:hypothetical protein
MKPHTKSKTDPRLRPLGPPRPGLLNKTEREEWREVVRACPPGVLVWSDSIFVELIARVGAKIRQGARGGWVRLYKTCLHKCRLPLAARRQQYRRLGI